MNETITIDIDQPKVYEIETHKMFDLKNISNRYVGVFTLMKICLFLFQL